MGRDYRKEYDDYHASPEQKKRRAARNRARREAMKEGKVRKGDGKEVDHINSNPLDNRDSNKRVTSRHFNRVNQGPKEKKRKK